MKWAASLIRISTFEVEMLQKRLAEIVDRRVAFEMRIASLDAEEEAERVHARTNAEAGIYLAGFRKGVQMRREKAAGRTGPRPAGRGRRARRAQRGVRGAEEVREGGRELSPCRGRRSPQARDRRPRRAGPHRRKKA
jgi:hypothetical protein